jgi:predicted phosphodiesterase
LDMRHVDLGTLDGALLLFGGVYSNRQSLDALIKVARARAIPAARMICTGDIIAYCGAPRESLALMQRLGGPVVAGNCELQLAENAADCGCGFDEGSACDLLSAGWYGHARGMMDDAARSWMAGLPDLLSFTHHGERYAVIHGGLSDVARFIWPTSDASVFEAEWDLIERAAGPINHVIAGHCGIPFIHQARRGRWINPGVIGMPPHDGRQQTRFGTLDGGEVIIERLSYDVAGAAADMTAAGLPDAYRCGLVSGYWPSEDVLPLPLRAPSLAKG